MQRLRGIEKFGQRAAAAVFRGATPFVVTGLFAGGLLLGGFCHAGNMGRNAGNGKAKHGKSHAREAPPDRKVSGGATVCKEEGRVGNAYDFTLRSVDAFKPIESSKMITGVNHITLAVRDIERSFRFYVDVFGLRPLARWSRGAYLLAGDLWLCLSFDAQTRSSPHPDYTHIAFSVSNFDECSKSLESYGATIWRINKSEGPSVYFLDPDGHKLEIHDGDWQTRLQSMRNNPWEDRIEFFQPT